MATATIQFTETTVPLVMPADFDVNEPITIEIISPGGAGGEPDTFGGGGGGGGGYARWEGVTLTNPDDCGVLFSPNAGTGDDVGFTDEDGLIRNVRGGTNGAHQTGGAGGTEFSSDHAPTIAYSGGAGGSTIKNGGGGGGASASASGNGADGSPNNGNNGGGAGGVAAGDLAGSGGNGGSLGQVGEDGIEFGGGGGGGGRNTVGNALGGVGVVQITYTIRLDAPFDSDMRGGMNGMRGGMVN